MTGLASSSPTLGLQDVAYVLPVGWWPRWGIAFTVLGGNPGSPFDPSAADGGLPLEAVAQPGGSPRHLDDVDASAATEPGKAGSVGAGSLDANLVDVTEALEPSEQRLVAGGSCSERLGAEESSERIECGGDMDVEMRVDATSDGARRFYSGHGHPFLP
jgi:hypothetical protein